VEYKTYIGVFRAWCLTYPECQCIRACHLCEDSAPTVYNKPLLHINNCLTGYHIC